MKDNATENKKEENHSDSISNNPSLTQEKITKPSILNLLSRKIKKSMKKKYFIWTALIVVLIIAATIFFFQLFSKLTITLSSEIDTKLSPQQQFVKISNRDSANLTFKITNNNLFQCDAICTLSFSDLSKNTTLSTIQLNMTHGQTLSQSYEIKGPGKGRGQIIYQLKTNCSNIKSLICATSGKESVLTSATLVDYDLSVDEKNIIENNIDYYKSLIESLDNLTYQFNSTEKIVLAIPNQIKDKKHFVSDIEEIRNQINSLTFKINTFSKLWNSESFELAAEQIDKTESLKIQELSTAIQNTDNSANTVLELYKDTLFNTIDNLENIENLQEMQIFYSQSNTPQNEDRLKRVEQIASEIHNTNLALTKNLSFYASSEYNRSILAKQQLSNSKITFLQDKTDLLFSRGFMKAFINLSNSTNLDSYIDTNNTCNDINNLRDILTQMHSYSNNLTDNITFIQNQTILMLNAVQNSISEINNAGINSTRLDEIKDAAFASAIQNNHSDSSNSYNFSENYAASTCANNNITLMPDAQLIKRLLSSNIQILKQNYAEAEQALEPKENFSTTPKNIEVKSKQCCAFGECQSCCTGNNCKQINYPVLFIHGHSFYEKNSPEISISLFDNVQRKMELNGFENLGRLDMQTTSIVQNGAWLEQNKPATITGSYYYITSYNVGEFAVTVRKEENLETYSIRLKELIEEVKRITGKDKVILVAHSMGGLVAREYILLFGTDSIEKLITINTPHHGISGRTEELCNILGSAKECNEMTEGSIFLNRLNARLPSQNISIYSIHSTGCLMNGEEDGDGVVTKKSAILEYAKNYEIKGVCTDALSSNLHNNVLNPEDYPEAYKLIVELIKN